MKRLISILMAMMLVIGMIPMTVFAEGEDTAPAEAVVAAAATEEAAPAAEEETPPMGSTTTVYRICRGLFCKGEKI